ncbi:MAG: hypothetical protein RIF32_08515, partial [Leptospirales bacterium]
LGIALQNEYRIPLIHRHAFLAGYCYLLGLADSDAWRRVPENDEERRQQLERAAAFLDKMGFVQGLGTVLRSSFFSTSAPEIIDQQFGGVLEDFAAIPDEAETQTADGDKNISLDSPGAGEAGDDEESGEAATPEVVDNAAVPVLIGVLKIARFAQEIIQNRSGQSNPARELVRGIAYNTAKGYFEKELAVGSLRRFKEYEADIRHLAALATVESNCIHGGRHAWAYPKPRATQVLCSENLLACPHIKGAWTFHLVTPQRAYGRIGRHLPVGTYHKCALEEDLPKQSVPDKGREEEDEDIANEADEGAAAISDEGAHAAHDESSNKAPGTTPASAVDGPKA